MSLAAVPVATVVIDDGAPAADALPAIVVSGPQLFPLLEAAPAMARFALAEGFALEVDAVVVGIRITQPASLAAVAEVVGTALTLNGEAMGAFAGTMSLKLSDTLIVTMQTASTGDDCYRLDCVTVTDNDRAMLISGLAALQRHADPLPAPAAPILVEQQFDGATIDDDTRDGLTLALAPEGCWTDELGARVTPDLLAQTQPGAPFGPGSTLLSYGEWARLISRLVASTMVWNTLATARGLPQPETRASESERSARDSAVRRALLLYEIERAAALRGAD